MDRVDKSNMKTLQGIIHSKQASLNILPANPVVQICDERFFWKQTSTFLIVLVKILRTSKILT